jgi:hypothetical protein
MSEAVGTERMSYVYAVVRADDARQGAADAAKGSLRFVTAGDVAALVGSVPADEFSKRALESRFNDLSRLEELARAHDRVVDTAHARMTVLPMRLATVYLDDERVALMLRERRDDFSQLLGWLEDHVEVGVKVYATATGASSPGDGDAPQPPDSPGRAYLSRRRAARGRREETYRRAGEIAARVPQVAAGLARARAVHRPQQGELTARAGGGAGAGENIANEAYLVARADEARFREALEKLTAEAPGVRIEVTGPWAPYSFAEAAHE